MTDPHPNTYSGFRFRMRANSTDASIIREIWDENCYLQGFVEQSCRGEGVVVDIGAHIGAFAVLAAKRLKPQALVAIEPEPSNFDYLMSNVGHAGLLDIVRPVRVALWSQSGHLVLFVDPTNTGGHSHSAEKLTLESVDMATVRRIDVPAVTLDELLSELGFGDVPVRLLKIDAEGAEGHILKGARATLRRTAVVVGELHEAIVPMAEALSCLDDFCVVTSDAFPPVGLRTFWGLNTRLSGRPAAIDFQRNAYIASLQEALWRFKHLAHSQQQTLEEGRHAVRILQERLGNLQTQCDAVAVTEAAMAALRTELQVRNDNIARLQRDVEARKGDIAALRREAQSRNRDIAGLQRDVETREADIATLGRELQVRDGAIAELRRDAQETTDRARRLEVDFNRVISSRSWRITRPLRGVYDMLCGPLRAANNCYLFLTRQARHLARWRPAMQRIDALIRAQLIRRNHTAFVLWQRIVRYAAIRPPAPRVSQPCADHRCPSIDGHGSDYEVVANQIRDAEQHTLTSVKTEVPPLRHLDGRSLVGRARELRFPRPPDPIVSIIVPVYISAAKHIRLTLECLWSVLEGTSHPPYELILVDDGSTGPGQDILRHLSNVRYIRNPANRGFLSACNRGAAAARGKYLLFLNNDTQVLEGWLPALISTFEQHEAVGAVGPKIIYPDGRLQEAGVMLNQDLSAQLIGLGSDPNLPRYNYVREVDYCSGACLLVEAARFRELGGFDETFAPAYCEDSDLCMRLRRQGLRVLYAPKSVIVHHLSATTDPGYKFKHVLRNQQKLAERWQDEVACRSQVRLIAFYLPQYHPIPENDRFWGKGFTEWRNVVKARPNFVGHYQPHLPSDLGFYDLRVASVMEEQVQLAKRYGIHGFCYFYYWFAGRRILEGPLERILKTNEPDFPFCLCWANENWTRRWDGRMNEVLLAQEHSDDDDRAVIRDLMRYLKHPNYIRVNGKPLLLVYRVGLFPDIRRTAEIWRSLCRQEAVGEIYLAAVESFEHAVLTEHPAKYGFDASVEFPPHENSVPTDPPAEMLNSAYQGIVYDYRKTVLRYATRLVPGYPRFRTVMPSWDNTPRRQDDAVLFLNASPGAYQAWLEHIVKQTREQNFGDERIVFINAWNEWAEGTHLEPDLRYGHAFLEATRNALESWLLYPR